MSQVQPVNRGIYSDGRSAGAHARGKNYVVTFRHIATGHSVSFPSAIQDFSDTHSPDTNEQTFTSQMDPMIQQDGTARNISFSFVIANSSVDEARYNQQSVNLLLQMMYPRYDYGDRNAVGSYIEISGLSFLRDSSTTNSTTCFITNLTYQLNTDQGFITPAPGELYPILLTISISAQALIPEATSLFDIDSINEQRGFEDPWRQPYPPTYPSYK
tara:strand:- start:22 stop:666 length:645 start_codon:yes stop_codon:yes gene_type:complete